MEVRNLNGEEESEEEEPAPEVPTRFASKGTGWSGREGESEDDED